MNPVLSRFLARLGLLRPDALRILVRADRLRVETALLVGCADGRQPVTFLIDSGCSVTTLDLAFAVALGMPTQGRRIRKSRTSAGGKRTMTVVQGMFRFWLSEEQRGAPFVAPIEFEEDQVEGVPPLFGLKGIINQLRWTIGPCRSPRGNILGSCLLQDVRRAVERYPS
jgi:hypothetical protein